MHLDYTDPFPLSVACHRDFCRMTGKPEVWSGPKRRATADPSASSPFAALRVSDLRMTAAWVVEVRAWGMQNNAGCGHFQIATMAVNVSRHSPISPRPLRPLW